MKRGRGFGSVLAASWLVALAACTSAPAGSSTSGDTRWPDVPLEHDASTAELGREDQRDIARASELYTTGEALFASGQYVHAVALWRHALLTVPELPRYDPLRHDLILRMGYGLTQAYIQGRDLEHLRNAERMLEAYVEKHASLFGDSEPARVQRDRVYALLGDITVAIEAHEASAARGASDGDPPTEVSFTPPVDIHAGEELGDEVARDVVVQKERPSVEKREVRDAFSDPMWSDTAGMVLTAPDPILRNPRRPLVRLRRLPQAVDAEGDASRKLAMAVVKGARPRLERCYSAAFARRPMDLVDLTVEVTLSPRGTLRKPTITNGKLVDGLGDACVLDALERSEVEAERFAADDEGRVALQFRFFWQRESVGDGATGMMPTPAFVPNDARTPTAADYASPGFR